MAAGGGGGRLLAEAGVTVVCGGGPGVMEAASRGAAGAGGTVIGILPGVSTAGGEPPLHPRRRDRAGQTRNLAVVASGEAAIAIGGEWGTLAEIAHARNLGRPVIALRSWSVSGVGEMAGGPGVTAADDPEQAVGLALGG